MAEDLINSIVNRPLVKKEIQDTTADLVVLQKQLVDTANSVVTLNAALGKSTNSKDLSGNITKVNQELEKTVKIREKIRTTIISNSQAEVDAYNKTINGEKKITETVNARDKAQARAANEATARGSKVIKQQEQQAKEYIRAQGLIEAARTRFERYKILADGATNPAQLQKYNQKIQATEIAIKQLGNAGKTGFDSLGNAIQKSGNLFSGIGQKVVTLARLLPGIGVIGLIAFATDPIINYIKTLDVFASKVSMAAETQKALNEVYQEANKETASQVTNLKYTYQAATDVTNAMEKRLDAAIALQKEYPTTFGLQTKENIINGEASGIYKQLTLDIEANARAKAAAARISAEEAKILDAQIQVQKIAIGGARENENIKKTLETRIKDALSYEFKRRGIASSGASFDKAVEAELQRQFLANNKLNEQKVKAQADIIKQAQSNINAVKNLVGGGTAIGNALVTDGGNAEDEKNREAERKKLADEAKKRMDDAIKLAQQQARELLDLQNDYEKQLADAKKAGDKIEEDRLKDILKNSEATFSQANSQRLLQIERDKSDVLSALADQYSQGLIKKQAYDEQVREIENQTSLESIASAIALAQDLIRIRQAVGEDTISEEEKLAKLQIQYSDMVTDHKLKNADKEQARQKELNGKIKELAEEAAQFVITLVNAGFENRKNKLQDEANAIDTNTQEQIKQVERSVGSEQVKADKIAVINAKAQADKARIAQQQKQIDIEKAKFDKAVAIARIIENTAVAVTAALTSLPPNVPLAFVVGAIGAIQLATAIAQPIPTYKDGTDNHKGGWAIFGEAGTEYVKEPGKAGYLTQGATLAPLPAGTQVISNADLMSAMANPSGGGYVSNQLDLSQLLQQNERHNKGVIKALETKQQANYLRGRRDEKKFGEYLKSNIN